MQSPIHLLQNTNSQLPFLIDLWITSTIVMYTRLIRSVGGSEIRHAARSDAAHRVIGGHSPNVSINHTRSIKSTTQNKGQAALAEAPRSEEPSKPVAQRPGIPRMTPLVDQTAQKVASKPQHRRFERELYWQKIPRWKDVTEKEFLSYRWQVC